MASTSYNDLGVVYNHPSIISNIYNNDTIFQSSAGSRPFFYVITSDRGEDNVTKLVSTDQEFLFNYGEPNLKKHGQAAYNILKILQAKESVYVLRVLPENAGYSHAFLNIQTKSESDKKVKNINGQLVSMRNVSIKPTVTFSKANNTSKELLDFELTQDRSVSKTVDGYDNNLLFYVLPKGRGSHYNKYGFRIYLNPSYDETYDFRVYNFEVIEYDEYENARVIEGPFYVSLDPDALSGSNESMFIEDVVNRYSQYVECKFNESAYDRVATIVNPDVAPAHLDLLSGETRVYNNVRENFFCKETQQYEDVHIRLHKYDNSGVVITNNGRPVNNIVDSNDKVEQSIISIDNSVRDNKYKLNLESLENMKSAISDISTGLYKVSLENIGKLEDGAFTEDSKIIVSKKAMDTAWTSLQTAIETFSTDKTEEKFSIAFAKSTELEFAVETIVKQLRFLTDYARMVDDNDKVLAIKTQLDDLQTIAETKEVVSIKLLNYKSKINEFISSIIRLKTTQSIYDEAEGLKLLLVDIYKIISFYKTYNGSAENDMLDSVVASYNDAVNNINLIMDEFTPDNKKEELLKNAYEQTEMLLPILVTLTNDFLLKNENEYGLSVVGNSEVALSVKNGGAKISSIVLSLQAILVKVIAEYDSAVSNETTKAKLIEKAKETANIQKQVATKSKSLLYTTQLQNFTSPIRFEFGNDGDLDISIPAKDRNKTMNNLLIKGYKGLIDANITNKKLIPARFVLDANYPVEVKNAMNTLVSEIRDDIFFYADLGFTVSPEEALNIRNNSFNVSNNKCAIYAQDATIYDEFNGRDIKVTSSYFLANKVPNCAREFGLHYPIAGNRRGIIDGFKNLSWIPNEVYKELLYNRKVNYIESDDRRTRFGSQLTSETKNSPLSNINNVITVIDIKNDVELMAEDYQFEFNDQDTINVFQNELNDYLSKYISSKAVETVNATVFASDYDKLQKILRVTLTIKFHDIIERIIISLDVVK